MTVEIFASKGIKGNSHQNDDIQLIVNDSQIAMALQESDFEDIITTSEEASDFERHWVKVKKKEIRKKQRHWLNKSDRDRLISSLSNKEQTNLGHGFRLRLSINEEISKVVKMIDHYYPQLHADRKIESLTKVLEKKQYRRLKRREEKVLEACDPITNLADFYAKSSSENMQFVKINNLYNYIELDREYETRSGNVDDDEVSVLVKKLRKCGYIGNPLVLMVNKDSGRGYIHDGNHRMAAFKRLSLEWVPVTVQYGGLYVNGQELFFPELPRVYDKGNWPAEPLPDAFGFGVKTHTEITSSKRE